ncbi:CRISPR associated protein Cas6 [Methanobrevibacter cuticularis]|uniref:CRISPR-associated endoribonuclease n=1 Tax=Methanobrevibacter cuticularis TaxID=47311 RepID=A0A166ETR1_9EURY|nr:CRISPR-associated endoribonuclease Cas6 [Methanobrevibacter cuticularis]KZX17003.1 CRISPR associated protein Cas6 [Methanobrevibacter cuticularis]
MRLKVSLKSENSLFIPFNYNHIISSIIYAKISDLGLAKELHSSKTFKFFTFSQIYIKRRKTIDTGIISTDGRISFQISSPNDNLIKSLVNGYLENLEVNFKGKKLFVEKIELMPNPAIKNKMNFKTLSPIIVRIKKEIDGELKTRELTPADQKFYENLEKNLVRKYNQFYDEEKKVEDININSEMKFIKRKRIAIEKHKAKTYHRAFIMDINIEGDLDLINFGYNCGIGEKNSLGFGMVE